MALRTQRFKSTQSVPHSLEAQTHLLGASTLLLFLEMLPGVRILSKRSFAMTDEFEAYFTYKDRLWLVDTPFSLIEVSLLGQPPNESLFQEIETRVRAYSPLLVFLLPFAFLRYAVARFVPSKATFRKCGIRAPGEAASDAL